MSGMEAFVADIPNDVRTKFTDIEREINRNWLMEDWSSAEASIEKQYNLMREIEDKVIPAGKRLHKGSCLHGWGLSILRQKDPLRVKEGYCKFFLAYIEDLLDQQNFSTVKIAPAYNALVGNPLIKDGLVDQLGNRVEALKRNGHISKDPEGILFDHNIVAQQDYVSQLFNGLRDEKPKGSNKVFVVHGHDEALKLELASTLDKLGLQPVILQEQPNEGRTIIEKFTECSDVGYAVVLLSPDDLVYPAVGEPEKSVHRARQNVILELGYFIGKLGRKRVMALYKESPDFDMPTDFGGVGYTVFDSSDHWKLKLVKELRNCNYNVSADDLP